MYHKHLSVCIYQEWKSSMTQTVWSTIYHRDSRDQEGIKNEVLDQSDLSLCFTSILADLFFKAAYQ